MPEILISRAYRLLKDTIGHVTRHLTKFKSKQKIVYIEMHSAVQIAIVTIISYKALSDLN